MVKMQKPVFGKAPKKPVVLSLQAKDLDIFKENSSSIRQLISVGLNNSEFDSVPGLSDSLNKSLRFLDDMVYLFTRLQQSDVVKIEK